MGMQGLLQTQTFGLLQLQQDTATLVSSCDPSLPINPVNSGTRWAPANPDSWLDPTVGQLPQTETLNSLVYQTSSYGLRLPAHSTSTQASTEPTFRLATTAPGSRLTLAQGLPSLPQLPGHISFQPILFYKKNTFGNIYHQEIVIFESY